MSMVLTLKVTFVDQGITKSLQFHSTSFIDAVFRELMEIARIDSTDYALFYPTLSKWLDPRKTLEFYDISSGDFILFRKKIRPLRVRLMDDSYKTVMIDETLPVSELVDAVCKRIGITNSDEYSFQSEHDQPHMKPDTSKGKKATSGADDEKWLVAEKSLGEQGIVESDVLLLKKKFFFSDQSVDKNDPIQLNLLYVQARDAILEGKHPCSLEEAVQLAALMLQTQYGNHEPDKHKPGFTKLNSLAPPEYQKKKDFEKKMYGEHRKLQGMSDINSKFRYVQLCRSLKTYGVTFFLVKEKVSKKNKLQPILLGVTRASIMKFDAETKEVIKKWPLTTLRRWAAAPNSLTLDFGDYADSYYSVQTSEGDAISQLIGGYIDIIIKKRKEQQQSDDGELVAVTEDMVRPAKAMAVNVMTNRAVRASEYQVASIASVGDNEGKVQAQNITRNQHVARAVDNSVIEHAYGPVHSAIVQCSSSLYNNIEASQVELASLPELPPLGDDPSSVLWKNQTLEMNKQNIASHVCGNLGNAVLAINCLAVSEPERMNIDSLAYCINNMGINLSQIASSAKLVAALLPSDDGRNLLNSAKMSTAALRDFIGVLQLVVDSQANDEQRKLARQRMYGAAKILGQTSLALLNCIGESFVPEQAQNELIELGKMVGKKSLHMVDYGMRPVINDCTLYPELTDTHRQLLSTAQNIGLSSEALVANLIACAATVTASSCHEQLTHGALALIEEVEKAEGIAGQIKTYYGESESLSALTACAADVRDALNRFFDRLNNPLLGYGSSEDLSGLEQQCDIVISGVNEFLAARATSSQIVSGAKQMTAITTDLINRLKEAVANENIPDGERLKFQETVKNLVQACSSMVYAAKDAARSADNPEKQQLLQSSLISIQNVAKGVKDDLARSKVFLKLAQASRKYASSATQLVSAAKTAAPYNQNQQSQIQLNHGAKALTEALSSLLICARAVTDDGTNPESQLQLLHAARYLVPSGEQFIELSQYAASYTAEDNSRSLLLRHSKQNAEHLAAIRTLVQEAEGLSASLEYACTLAKIKYVQSLLADAQNALESGSLMAPEDADIQAYHNELSTSHKATSASLAQLLSAVGQPDKLFDFAGRELATSFERWTHSVIGMTGHSSQDQTLQQQLLNTASMLGAQILDLIVSAKSNHQLLDDGNGVNDEDGKALKQLHDDIQDGLVTVLDFLPGKRDLHRAIYVVNAGLDILESGRYEMPQIDFANATTYQNAQSQLNAAANLLLASCNNLVNAARSGVVSDLSESASEFEGTFSKLLEAAKLMLAQSQDKSAQQELLAFFKVLGRQSVDLLSSSKNLQLDTLTGRQQLLVAAENMAGAISDLLSNCTSLAPGLSECNRAESLLNSAAAKLDIAHDPAAASRTESYATCFAKNGELTRVIVTSVTALASATRSNQAVKIGEGAVILSGKLVEFAEVTARACFLIARAETSNTGGALNILDKNIFEDHYLNIKEACQSLVSPTNSQDEILAAASAIAKHTSLICGACKQASQNANVSNAMKQQLVLSAKSIANCTSELVKSIKLLASEPSESARSNCHTSSKPLIDAASYLLNVINTSNTAEGPIDLSSEDLEKVKPVTDSGLSVLSNASQIIAVLKLLCGRPESQVLQQFITLIKTFTDSLKSHSNSLRQHAPGYHVCDEAIETIGAAINDLNSVLVQAHVSNLNLSDSYSGVDSASRSIEESIISSIKALGSLADIVATIIADFNENPNSCKGIADFVPSVKELSHRYHQIALSCSENETLTVSQPLAEALKKLGECTLNFLDICKESLVDIKITKSKICEAVDEISSAVKFVEQSVESGTSEVKEFSHLIVQIQKTLDKFKAVRCSVDLLADIQTPLETFEQLAKKLNEKSKHMIEFVSEVIAKSAKADIKTLSTLCHNMTFEFLEINKLGSEAASACADDSMKESILDQVRDLGYSTLKLIETTKVAAGSYNGGKQMVDQTSRQKINSASRDVSQQVSKLINITQQALRLNNFVEQGIEQIDCLISDIQSQLIFVHAGQFDSNDNAKFSSYKENLLMYSTAVANHIEHMQTLHNAQQKEQSEAVSEIVSTLSSLQAETKLAAASISPADKDMQERLLNGFINIAQSLVEFIKVTDGAVTGSERNSAEIDKHYCKTKIGIDAFKDTIKIAEDESSRRGRSLDKAIADISSALKAINDGSVAQGSALPDEVVNAAKQLATAAAQLVSTSSKTQSSQNPQDILQSVDEFRNLALDLVRCSMASVENAPEQPKAEMVSSIQNTARASISLLEKIKLASNTPASRLTIQQAAAEIATAVSKIVNAAGNLIPGGYVDPNDPNVIAERELLAAASSIEAAARKLATLQPPERPREANENLNFEEQILEAAKAIAAATGALLKTATSAQREIMVKGKAKQKTENIYFSDGTWSEGLVSAAKFVAAATSDLCEAANAALKGEVQREKVIAAARAVSSSTVQLVTAAAVKADPNSQVQIRLKAAGKSVTQATEMLVKAADESMALQETPAPLMKNSQSGVALQRAKELDAQARVLQMEKELELARVQLSGLRKGKYTSNK